MSRLQWRFGGRISAIRARQFVPVADLRDKAIDLDPISVLFPHHLRASVPSTLASSTPRGV
jgi:hypothetical protein